MLIFPKFVSTNRAGQLFLLSDTDASVHGGLALTCALVVPQDRPVHEVIPLGDRARERQDTKR